MADPLYMRCPKCGFRMPRCELRNIKRCPGCSSTSAYVEDYDDPTRHWQAQSAEIAALRVEVERLTEQMRQSNYSADTCCQATVEAIHKMERLEMALTEAHKACEINGDKLDDANRRVSGLKAHLRKSEERAERAEALLAKATGFRVGDGETILRVNSGKWRVRSGLGYDRGIDGRWEWNTFDAALAAYEQSRENTE